MKSKAALALAATMMVLHADSNEQFISEIQEKRWKPEFTEEELEHLRSLPRKDRKKAVRELRARYYKETVK